MPGTVLARLPVTTASLRNEIRVSNAVIITRKRTSANSLHASSRACFCAAVTPARKSMVRIPELLPGCRVGAPTSSSWGANNEALAGQAVSAAVDIHEQSRAPGQSLHQCHRSSEDGGNCKQGTAVIRLVPGGCTLPQRRQGHHQSVLASAAVPPSTTATPGDGRFATTGIHIVTRTAIHVLHKCSRCEAGSPTAPASSPSARRRKTRRLTAEPCQTDTALAATPDSLQASRGATLRAA